MGRHLTSLRYLGFVVAGYFTAFCFEIIASALDPKNATFKNPAWPVFFVIWYGFLYSVSFATLRTRPVWVAAAVWAVVGTVLEIVVFHRLNIIVDPIVYAIMFAIPHKIYQARGAERTTDT
jgi:multidrug transporter EmrE-like cation transporter